MYCALTKEVSNLGAPHPGRYQELMGSETCPEELLPPEEVVGGQGQSSPWTRSQLIKDSFQAMEMGSREHVGL